MLPDASIRYRLVIEGDEPLMRQIAEALDLQGRLHLGQFEEVYRVLEYGVVDRARKDGIPLSAGACHPEASEKVRLRDELTPAWVKACFAYETAFRLPSPLAALSPHLSRRESRAYTLWKWMEHWLMHERTTPENEHLLRRTVHWQEPILVQPDITVTLERLEMPEKGGEALRND